MNFLLADAHPAEKRCFVDADISNLETELKNYALNQAVCIERACYREALKHYV